MPDVISSDGKLRGKIITSLSGALLRADFGQTDLATHQFESTSESFTATNGASTLARVTTSPISGLGALKLSWTTTGHYGISKLYSGLSEMAGGRMIRVSTLCKAPGTGSGFKIIAKDAKGIVKQTSMPWPGGNTPRHWFTDFFLPVDRRINEIRFEWDAAGTKPAVQGWQEYLTLSAPVNTLGTQCAAADPNDASIIYLTQASGATEASSPDDLTITKFVNGSYVAKMTLPGGGHGDLFFVSPTRDADGTVYVCFRYAGLSGSHEVSGTWVRLPFIPNKTWTSAQALVYSISIPPRDSLDRRAWFQGETDYAGIYYRAYGTTYTASGSVELPAVPTDIEMVQGGAIIGHLPGTLGLGRVEMDPAGLPLKGKFEIEGLSMIYIDGWPHLMAGFAIGAGTGKRHKLYTYALDYNGVPGSGDIVGGEMVFDDVRVTQLGASQVRFVRNDGSGENVRGGDPAEAPGGIAYAYDDELRPGFSQSWFAYPIYSTGQVGVATTSVQLTVDDRPGSLPSTVIKSLLDPNRSVQVYLDQHEIDMSRSVSVVNLQQGGQPVGGINGDYSYSGDWTFVTMSEDDDAAMWELLKDPIIYLQFALRYRIEPFYAIPYGIKRKAFAKMDSQERTWTISLQQVSRPSTFLQSSLLPVRTYAELALNYGSYAEIADFSYFDLTWNVD